MAEFPKKAIAAALALILGAVFAAEGGYVNDPRDPGGETNHGITKRVAVANGYTGPMPELKRDRAREIYVRQYIEEPGYMPIVERDPAVAEEIVDTGVNAGPGRASRWFQESLNVLNNRGRDWPDIAEDGKVGPGTIAALDALRRKRGPVLSCQLLLRVLDAKQLQHYAGLAASNDNFESFMTGWIRTRIHNVDEAQCGKAVA